jgi:hypothetical protein
VGAGGASLHSLVRHEGGSHLGTYYRVAGPLIARLLAMGGSTPRKVAAFLLHPAEHVHGEGGGWAMHLNDAHRKAVNLQESFTANELQTSLLLAPRRLVITVPWNPSNVAKDLPPWTRTFSQQAPYPLGAPEVSSMLRPA